MSRAASDATVDLPTPSGPVRTRTGTCGSATILFVLLNRRQDISKHSWRMRFGKNSFRIDPRSGIGFLPHGFCHLLFPFSSRTRFSRSIPKPALSSCRLYTGCHRVRKQVSSRFLLDHRHDPVSTAPLTYQRCVIGRFAFAHLLNTHLTP